MLEGNVEYMLKVWKSEPEDTENLSHAYWSARIEGAQAIPRIGQTLESSNHLDKFSRYKVFDVIHDVGGNLAHLTMQGQPDVRKIQISDCIRVLAYRVSE